MVVVSQQQAARLERGGGSSGPGIQVVERMEPAAAVDEVEASPLELERKLLDIGLEENRIRCALAGDGGRLPGNVHAGDERAELRELRARFARAALEVQHMLSLQLRQPLPNRVGNAQVPGQRIGALAVDLVPGSAILVRRLHG